jgi:hypothetical protein
MVAIAESIAQLLGTATRRRPVHRHDHVGIQAPDAVHDGVDLRRIGDLVPRVVGPVEPVEAI